MLESGVVHAYLMVCITECLGLLICSVSPSGHGVASIPIQVLYSHAGPVGTAEDLSSQTTKSKYHVIRQVIQITCKVT